MKKVILCCIPLLFACCAKNDPEFVPLSIDWFHYEGDIRVLGGQFIPAAIDSAQEEKCIISLTRALMEADAVRKQAKDGENFDVQYFGRAVSGEASVEFRGICNVENKVDLESTVLDIENAAAKENCRLTARCGRDGSVEKLRIF